MGGPGVEASQLVEGEPDTRRQDDGRYEQAPRSARRGPDLRAAILACLYDAGHVAKRDEKHNSYESPSATSLRYRAERGRIA